MQSFLRLFRALLQIGPTFLPVIFSFLQDSGVRAWASYDHASGASGLHNRFTHCEAKKVLEFCEKMENTQDYLRLHVLLLNEVA